MLLLALLITVGLAEPCPFTPTTQMEFRVGSTCDNSGGGDFCVRCASNSEARCVFTRNAWQLDAGASGVCGASVALPPVTTGPSCATVRCAAGSSCVMLNNAPVCRPWTCKSGTTFAGFNATTGEVKCSLCLLPACAAPPQGCNYVAAQTRPGECPGCGVLECPCVAGANCAADETCRTVLEAALGGGPSCICKEGATRPAECDAKKETTCVNGVWEVDTTTPCGGEPTRAPCPLTPCAAPPSGCEYTKDETTGCIVCDREHLKCRSDACSGCDGVCVPSTTDSSKLVCACREGAIRRSGCKKRVCTNNVWVESDIPGCIDQCATSNAVRPFFCNSCGCDSNKRTPCTVNPCPTGCIPGSTRKSQCYIYTCLDNGIWSRARSTCADLDTCIGPAGTPVESFTSPDSCVTCKCAADTFLGVPRRALKCEVHAACKDTKTCTLVRYPDINRVDEVRLRTYLSTRFSATDITVTVRDDSKLDVIFCRPTTTTTTTRKRETDDEVAEAMAADGYGEEAEYETLPRSTETTTTTTTTTTTQNTPTASPTSGASAIAVGVTALILALAVQ